MCDVGGDRRRRRLGRLWRQQWDRILERRKHPLIDCKRPGVRPRQHLADRSRVDLPDRHRHTDVDTHTDPDADSNAHPDADADADPNAQRFGPGQQCGERDRLVGSCVRGGVRVA